MLMLRQTVLDWVGEGMLGNVAASEGWDAALPKAVKDFTKVDGHAGLEPCIGDGDQW